MGYRLGVDLGTTFVAAARSGHSQAEMVTLGDRSVVMPSAVYVGEDGRMITGFAAERRAAGDPDRVARQFKRRLGDPTPLRLGEATYRTTELLAVLLRDVLARVTETEGAPPAQVTLTHPANWGPFRRGVFAEVSGLAGLAGAHTITEPEAAALYYARSRQLDPGDTVAVYDLGGGTFDATVLRKTSEGVQTLGTPEGVERLGGIDFDQALFDFVAYSSDGALADLDPRDSKTAVALARLRQDCVLAKESLSVDTEVVIPVFLPRRQFDVRITRDGFEELIRAQVESTINPLTRALRSAQVAPAELTAVLLVGGSSRIPLVARMVSEELGKPVLVDTHPKYAVALGAATLSRGPDPGASPGRPTTVAAPPAPALSAPAVGAGPTATMPAGAPAVVRAAAPSRPLGLADFGVVGNRRAGRYRRFVKAHRRSVMSAVLLPLIGLAGFLYFAAPASDAVVLLGTDQRGDDPFGPSLVLDAGIRPTAGLDAAAREDPSGDQDGLYFDAMSTSSCDRAALDGALRGDRELAGAWGGVLSITATNAPLYLAALTPARLRADTRVTGYSYAHGEARPHSAILQAGSAVLIDDRGLPRVSCANSDPLAAPTPLPAQPHYTGTPWPGFDPATAVEIHPADAAVREFGLVNAAGATQFRRKSGDDGTHDVAQLPTTGQPDGAYAFTGAITSCDHVRNCEGVGHALLDRITFSDCPDRCAIVMDGVRTPEGNIHENLLQKLFLTRQGGSAQYGMGGTLAASCANTKYNGSWHTTFTVTNSAVVDGVWKATQLKMDEQRVWPSIANCNSGSFAFSLTGTAQ